MAPQVSDGGGRLPARVVAIASTAVALGAGLAAAHPGHGVAGGSFDVLHYLTEPAHGLGAVLGIVAAASIVAWALHRR